VLGLGCRLDRFHWRILSLGDPLLAVLVWGGGGPGMDIHGGNPTGLVFWWWESPWFLRSTCFGVVFWNPCVCRFWGWVGGESTGVGIHGWSGPVCWLSFAALGVLCCVSWVSCCGGWGLRKKERSHCGGDPLGVGEGWLVPMVVLRWLGGWLLGGAVLLLLACCWWVSGLPLIPPVAGRCGGWSLVLQPLVGTVIPWSPPVPWWVSLSMGAGGWSLVLVFGGAGSLGCSLGWGRGVAVAVAVLGGWRHPRVWVGLCHLWGDPLGFCWG